MVGEILGEILSADQEPRTSQARTPQASTTTQATSTRAAGANPPNPDLVRNVFHQENES